MPLSTEHPDYVDYKPQWRRCRDVLAGEDAVKAAGELYLPKLGSHAKKPKEYAAYKLRALFYGATKRTLSAMIGAVFRKPPEIEPPSDYVAAQARPIVEEVLSVGRVGVLVDVPLSGGVPYMVVYQTEQIVNWRYAIDGDAKVLELVVLKEVRSEPQEADPYVLESVTYYRVLEINADGIYQQTLYREYIGAGGARVATHSIVDGYPVTPTIRGELMGGIPFVIVGPNNNDPDVDPSPIIDLVDVNLSHYRTSADLEHGRHFTALPTAWVAGFPDDSVLEIGSGTAWVTQKTDARAGFLEFTGQGLRALETAMASKENLMANLGARMFDTQKSGVESEGALRIRSASETATLAGIVTNITAAMTMVYQWMVALTIDGGDPSEVYVRLNDDLVDTTLSANDLTALVSAWQQGAISRDTLLYNLKVGEILPPDVTADDEKERIALDMAAPEPEQPPTEPPPQV